MTAEENTQQGADSTRGRGSSAPTWEYGAPDLGLGPMTPRVGSDGVVLDGVEG